MIKIDFEAFLFDNNLSPKEVSIDTKIPLQTIYLIKNRGSVRPATLKTLKEKYSIIDNYKIRSKK